MRRLLPLVASIAVAALVLTGCGSEPSRSDAAAIVGGQVVPLDLVQQRLRTAAPDLQATAERSAAQQGTAAAPTLTPADLAGESRRLVTVSVLHQLITEQSRRDGIVVPPTAVDGLLARAGGAEAAAAGSGFDAATLRELVGDQIAAAEIGRRAFDRLTTTVDVATVPDRAAADALAARVAADPDRVATAFAGLAPGSSATGLTLRPGTDQGGGARTSASSLVFGLPAGTVSVTSSAQDSAGSGAPAPDPSTRPWTVLHVRDRSLSAPPPGPGTVTAARTDDDTMINFGLRLLQPLGRELGVTVNPRFGTWDPTQLGIATSPAGAGTIRPVAGRPAP